MSSSQIGDRTLVSYSGRQILYHWATREALLWFLKASILKILRRWCLSPSWVSLDVTYIIAMTLSTQMLRVCWKWSESDSHSIMSDSLWPHGLYSPWNSPGQNTGVDSRSLLQGIFPSQGLNQGLPHCRWILYQLSYQGSPWLLITMYFYFFMILNYFKKILILLIIYI